MEKEEQTLSPSPKSTLTVKQKYAVGALIAIALHRTQTRHILLRQFTSPSNDDDNGHHDGPKIHHTQSRRFRSFGHHGSSNSDKTHLWTHHSHNLLRPIFRFLEIDRSGWDELEEAALHLHEDEHHVGYYVKLLMEESGGISSEVDNEVALAKGIDTVSSNMEKSHADHEQKKKKQREYKHACQAKFAAHETTPESDNTKETSHDETHDATTTPSVEQSLKRLSTFESNEQEKFEEVAMVSYSRKITVLYELLSACLANIPEDNQSAHRRIGYDARHRVALRLLATWFELKWLKLEAIETTVACSVMRLLNENKFKEGRGESSDDSWSKWKRGGIIGAAAITGGTLMAITGGLAAPAIAAGFTALAPTVGTIIPVIGASGCAIVASVAGSAAGSAAVAASFGAAGAGLTGTKMAKRMGDIEEFEFKAIGENHNKGRLAMEITISGFVHEEEDFIKPWEEQHDNLERYTLQWESKHLTAISHAIQDWLTSKALKEIMMEGAMTTTLSALMAAVAWPATLLSATKFIDSKWAIAIDRSDKAGILLAEVLQKGLQGNRPVTLVGFSLGARVIFKCLHHLAENGINAGIVESVVLLGAPISIHDTDWGSIRKIVAGRFINVYSTNDWMLGIAFRATLLSTGMAGIQAIEVPGIENVDVSEVIEGHSSYLWATQQILDHLHMDTYTQTTTSSFNHEVFRT